MIDFDWLVTFNLFALSQNQLHDDNETWEIQCKYAWSWNRILNSDNNGITKSNTSCSILKRWVIWGRGRVILRWGLVNLKYSLLQIRLITTQKLCNTGNMGLADWEEKEKIKCRLNLKYYCRLVSQQDQSKTSQSQLRDEEFRMTGQGSPSYWFLVFTDTKTLFQLLKLLSLKQENY